MYQKKRDKCEGKRKDWGKKRKGEVIDRSHLEGGQSKRDIEKKRDIR